MNTKKWTFKTKWFDFSKARVRTSEDGKTWRTEDKFGIAYFLGHINHWKYLYAYETHNYKELKEALREELKTYSEEIHINI